MFKKLTGLSVFVVFASLSFAEDKKVAETLNGTWVRTAENFELKFEFGKEKTLKFSLDRNGNGVSISCKYEIESDGTIQVTIDQSENKGDFDKAPKKGDKFSFKWNVDGKTAKLSEFKTTLEAEQAKNILEGEYKLQD